MARRPARTACAGPAAGAPDGARRRDERRAAAASPSLVGHPFVGRAPYLGFAHAALVGAGRSGSPRPRRASCTSRSSGRRGPSPISELPLVLGLFFASPVQLLLGPAGRIGRRSSWCPPALLGAEDGLEPGAGQPADRGRRRAVPAHRRRPGRRQPAGLARRLRRRRSPPTASASVALAARRRRSTTATSGSRPIARATWSPASPPRRSWSPSGWSRSSSLGRRPAQRLAAAADRRRPAAGLPGLRRARRPAPRASSGCTASPRRSAARRRSTRSCATCCAEAKELLHSERAEVAFVASDGGDVAHVRLGADRTARPLLGSRRAPTDQWLLSRVVGDGDPLLLPAAPGTPTSAAGSTRRRPRGGRGAAARRRRHPRRRSS